jgi:hypothetical protein
MRTACSIASVLWRNRAQHVRLLLDRGDDRGVLVANVDVHQLRGEVHVGRAILVGDVDALRVAHHHGVDRRLRGPGVKDRGLLSLLGGEVRVIG